MKSISLVSHSIDTDITFPVLQRIAAGLTRQQVEHYGPFSQSQGIIVEAYQDLSIVPKDSVLAVVFDASPDAGVLGYHDVSPNGTPYEKIFWQPIKHSGGTLGTGDNSLSVTLSHECLEMVDDPYANIWADMPDGLTEDAHELCDRVEGDSYDLDGVAVSNFLGPRAFRLGAGPYDFLGAQGDARGLKNPFDVRPNAYCIRRTGGPSGKVTSSFGMAYPEHKKAAKLAKGSRAARRGHPTMGAGHKPTPALANLYYR